MINGSGGGGSGGRWSDWISLDVQDYDESCKGVGLGRTLTTYWYDTAVGVGRRKVWI